MSERHRAKLTTLMFVRRNRQVLLQQHAAGSRFSGLWNGVGGHVEAGEDVCRAARREVREEAGIEVREPRLRFVLHERDRSDEATLVFWFVADWLSGALRPEPRRVLRWVPDLEIEKLPLLADIRAVWPRLFENGAVQFGVESHAEPDAPRLEIDGKRVTPAQAATRDGGAG